MCNKKIPLKDKAISGNGDNACRHNFGESMSIGIIVKNKSELEP